MAADSTQSVTAAQSQLVDLFHRNGYNRVPDETRRAEEPRTYKMGYEIRLIAQNKAELAIIRRLLRTVGLKPGKPYSKANQWCQPVYGKSAMETFSQWIDELD